MKRIVRVIGWLAVLATTLALGARPAAAAGAPDATSVLILDSTVTGGAGSVEATKAAALGYTVEVATAATWAAKTTAEFATYRAIILGDPTCQLLGADAAATANAAVWGPAVNGNVIVVGSDPVFHVSQGGDQLTEKGIAFAASEPAKTGAYITLSCYYHGVAANTPVPLLSGAFGGSFTVTGVGCFNDAHIVASSPALSGLTDATISNWSCSVHEAFDGWPASFQVLAIARGIGSVFTAPDGSVGTPYILARGETLVTLGLAVSPLIAANSVGTSHTVTATLTDPGSGDPLVGRLIRFAVTAGPNTGVVGACSPVTCRTDVSGQVTFTYLGSGIPGMDTIFVYADTDEDGSPDLGEPQVAVAKTWVSGCTPADCDDGNPCTDDSCGSVGGAFVCGHGPNAAPCDDGDACTGPGVCSAGACTAGASNGTCPDHYKCYRTRTSPFASRVVTLADQFTTTSATVLHPTRFCNPADKNGEGIVDPTAHLMCYQIREATFPRRVVRVRNQFGDQTLTVVKPEALCTPAEKNGVPSVLNVNHYKCYRVRGTGFTSRAVALADQFESRTETVVKPRLLCNPVDKNGGGILAPENHVVCYTLRAAGAFAPQTVTVEDQFSAQDLLPLRGECRRRSLLCVPSEKNPGPSTTSTSSSTTTSTSATTTSTLASPSGAFLDDGGAPGA